MKKLLIVLLLSMCPMVVLADGGGPMIIGYDAVVINKNGTKAYSYDTGKNITIKYNTKIRIYNELDGGDAEGCYSNGKGECEENKTHFTILLKDIAPLKKEITPKDIKTDYMDKVDSELLITAKNGLKAKKGPANIYDSYSETIPYNTTVKTDYEAGAWYHINDEKYKGWIMLGAALHVNSSIMTFKEIKLHNIDTDTLLLTIPEEEVISDYYVELSSDYHDSFRPNYYVTYKDKFGKFQSDDGLVGYTRDGDYRLITLTGTELKSQGKSITGVPKGIELKVLYEDYTDAYYVEYNNVKGFIDIDDCVGFYSEDIEKETYEEDKTIYNVKYSRGDGLVKKGTTLAEYSKKFETNRVIPAYSEVTYYGNYSLYEEETGRAYWLHLVKYNNNIGWVISSIDESNMIIQPTPVVTPRNTPVEENPKSKTISIIIYSVIGAAILSLTALVTIKLINKKKKKKQEVKKEEVKVEKPVTSEIKEEVKEKKE